MKKHHINPTTFLLYLVIVILLNAVGATVFTRLDLTGNRMYSLSNASKDVVSTLSDPLTIKVFFTSNLPAPYNNVERYLHDILEEYSIAGNRYFNYQFFDVSAEGSESGDKNRELAGSYGIHPVQIQNIEQDEVKFQKAYMGLVMIHGDMIETIPTVTSTDGLEYTITSKIRKMNNKISALINLKSNIQVEAYISSSLYSVLKGSENLKPIIEQSVKELNGKMFGKLNLNIMDPSGNTEIEKQAEQKNIVRLQWNRNDGSQTEAPEYGFAGVVVSYGDQSTTIQLLNVVRSLFGTQYQLAEKDELKEKLERIIESVIQINEKVGYLTGHGTPELGMPFQMPGQPVNQEALKNFNTLISEEYTVEKINLSEQDIPEDLSCLIINGAKENFSDYELFQIDQFLMRGNNLAVFVESFNEMMPQQNRNMMMGGQQGPYYLPLNTGLEKLLSHYGVSVSKSYVMDENCFKQQIPQQFGGGEQNIYFAPLIQNENISKDFDFMKNIKGLVMLKTSPVVSEDTVLKSNGLNFTPLFSSSNKSWEMKGRINLNPMFIREPENDSEFGKFTLAGVLQGEFSSYFNGKEIPVRDVKKEESEEEKESTPQKDMSFIKNKTPFISNGKPGKIFITGSTEILKDNVLDEQGISPNSQFVLNVIDALNNREANAVMRSKTQRFNPLKPVSSGVKMSVKGFNIAGLPILVVIAGLFVWLNRNKRKKIIRQIFDR